MARTSSKYYVGDTVTIKHDLVVNADLDVLPEMASFAGQTTVVTKVIGPVTIHTPNDNIKTFAYKVDIDDGEWTWYEYTFTEDN